MRGKAISNVSETDFSAQGTPAQKLSLALKYAVLAPSEHNWQPWQFRLVDQHLELFANDDPALEGVDPDGRELIISCGTSLFYLKLALKHFGCLGRVELFPDLDQPKLLARVFCGFGHVKDPHEHELFEAMTQSRVSPSSFRESPISQATLEMLRDALWVEKAWVEFSQSEYSRQRWLALAAAGGRREMPAAHSRNEPDFQVDPGGATRSGTGRNGPLQLGGAQLPRPVMALTVSTSDSGSLGVESNSRATGPKAPLAVLKSKTDDKRGWLATGQAMARVLLQAQASGLSWWFSNQALRRRNTREELRTAIGRKGFPQAIMRFGSRVPEMVRPPGAPQSVTAALW
jgi:nitroreductase